MFFDGTVKVKLNKPFTWEGKKISEVNLDFSKVTGKVINDAERGVFQGGNMAMVRPMSADYCGRIAAAISGVHFRALEKMPACDYDTIWQTVGAFVNNRDPQEFYDEYTSGEDYVVVDDEGDAGDFTKAQSNALNSAK